MNASQAPETNKNISQLKAANAAEIAASLLKGFADAGFEPLLQLADDPSATLQLQNLFECLDDPGDQVKFKEAIVKALAGWQPRTHNAEKVIQRLTRLVAYVRAEQAINYLCALFRLGRLIPEEDERIIETVIAVLYGFAPLPEVQTLFEALFYREDFAPFAAQLFLGLCVCQPERYPKYISRFLYLNKKYPDYYVMPFVMWEFERIVSLPVIVRNLGALDKEKSEAFLNMLCSSSDDPKADEYPVEVAYINDKYVNGKQISKYILRSKYSNSSEDIDSPYLFIFHNILRKHDTRDTIDELTISTRDKWREVVGEPSKPLALA